MAWYEAHQTMAKHPKTLKLAQLLKVERRYAVGLLHDLFSWALDAAGKYGELPGITDDAIAMAMDIPAKKAKLFVAALVDSGYLEVGDDGVYSIHDWYDYAGKLMEKREADKERKAEEARKRREKKLEFQNISDGIPLEIRRTSSGIPLVTVPNRTVPNESLNTNSAPARETDAWQQLIPTREEVRAYAAEIQSKADPDQFFDYFSAGDWHDRNGDPVRNWRQKFAVWNNLRNDGAPQRGEKKSLTFYDVAQNMKARGEF